MTKELVATKRKRIKEKSKDLASVDYQEILIESLKDHEHAFYRTSIILSGRRQLFWLVFNQNL
jgi:hypothetical protein